MKWIEIEQEARKRRREERKAKNKYDTNTCKYKIKILPTHTIARTHTLARTRSACTNTHTHRPTQTHSQARKKEKELKHQNKAKLSMSSSDRVEKCKKGPQNDWTIESWNQIGDRAKGTERRTEPCENIDVCIYIGILWAHTQHTEAAAVCLCYSHVFELLDDHFGSVQKLAHSLNRSLIHTLVEVHATAHVFVWFYFKKKRRRREKPIATHWPHDTSAPNVKSTQLSLTNVLRIFFSLCCCMDVLTVPDDNSFVCSLVHWFAIVHSFRCITFDFVFATTVSNLLRWYIFPYRFSVGFFPLSQSFSNKTTTITHTHKIVINSIAFIIAKAIAVTVDTKKNNNQKNHANHFFFCLLHHLWLHATFVGCDNGKQTKTIAMRSDLKAHSMGTDKIGISFRFANDWANVDFSKWFFCVSFVHTKANAKRLHPANWNAMTPNPVNK